MYRLFIMDDVAQAAQAARAMVEAGPLASDVEIVLVRSEEELFDAIQMGKTPDILLADIELGDDSANGIDVVRRLFPAGSSTQVIYVTGHVEYCTPVYETEHVYFLTKPLQQEDLDRALLKARDNVDEARQSVLPVRFSGTLAAVSLSDITYLESKRRKMEVHTEQGVYQTYATIAEVMERLPDHFVQCHKSYIANLDYVSRLDPDGLLLSTGERIPVSQRRRQETRERFFKHMGKA